MLRLIATLDPCASQAFLPAGEGTVGDTRDQNGSVPSPFGQPAFDALRQGRFAPPAAVSDRWWCECAQRHRAQQTLGDHGETAHSDEASREQGEGIDCTKTSR